MKALEAMEAMQAMQAPAAVANLSPEFSTSEDAALQQRRFGGMERLYGVAAAARIRAAHVVVVGIGGVGSWTVEALARSGVGQLTLVDLDHIAESNINRQVHALETTLGQAKGGSHRHRRPVTMAVERAIAFDLAGSIRRRHRFAAEHAGDAHGTPLARSAMELAQLLAQLCQQGVVRDQRQVCHIDAVGLALASGRAHGHIRHAGLDCPCRHGNLGLPLIAGVHHALDVERHQL